MTTQVSFVADEDLKTRALEKAKEDGVTLKAFFIYAMKGYVDGKISLTIDVVKEEPEVEELFFEDESINKKASKLAKLLK